MDKILIIGAGRQGRENYSYLRDLQANGVEIELVGFVDELKPKGKFQDTKIIGNIGDLKHFLDSHEEETFSYITAIGDINLRQRVVDRISYFGIKNIVPYTLIHPTASIGRDVEIGEGTCMAPNTTLTTNISIGKHCIVNSNVSISHDCVVGNYANLNPSSTLCGDVNMGDECFVGAGSTVIDKIKIGNKVIIGSGAVVIENVQSNITVAGVPAKMIRVGRKKK